MPKTWEIKSAQARALVEQVRQLNAEGKDGASGIDSGEKATMARKLLADAKRLGDEAKAERKSAEADETKALMERFDAGKGVETTDVIGDRKSAPAPSPFETGPKSGRLVLSKSLAKVFYGAGARDLKIFSEGSGANGEFLVVPDIHQEMFAEVRTAGNALRSLGWINVHQTAKQIVKIPRGAGSTTVAWTGQNQPAPSSDMDTDQITIEIFKILGITKLTFESDADSDPSAANFAVQDLARRAALLEEATWYSGTGTNEPYGIFNTPATQTKTFGAGADTVQEQIDLVADMLQDLLTNHYAAATGILVHPRRYGFWRKAKDSQNNYLFNPAGSFRAPSAVAKSQYDAGDLLGVPLGMSPNLPTNLGSGTNEDRIIVADWTEAHVWMRSDVQVDYNDRSDTAWTNDQLHARLRIREGFSAERYPKAFSIGGGAGLAVV